MTGAAPRVLAVVALVLGLALPGCGDETTISHGGRVAGTTLTVYSLLPRTGPHARASADIVRGEKLALAQAGGRVGGLTVNYSALDEPVGPGGEVDPEKVAEAVREAVHDLSLIAVIGDLDSATARVSVPLLNAAGILHVSPGAGSTTFGQPSDTPTLARLVPSDGAQAAALATAARGRVAVEAEGSEAAQALASAVQARVGRTVDTARADTVVYAGSDAVNARGVVEGVLEVNRRARVLLPQELWTTDLPAQLRGPRVRFETTVSAQDPPGFDAAFARAFPGVAPGPLAKVGWSAMRAVLDAIRRAGPGAQSRQAVVEAFLTAHPPARVDAQPFRLAR